MKRIYLGLLLLATVAYGLACETQTNNNNSTPNANANTSPSPAIGYNTNDNKNGDLLAFGEIMITITIADDGKGDPYIAKVSPDSADLSGGMKAYWLVENQSKNPKAQNATVEIGPFKAGGTTSGTPFGPDACENKFILNFIKEGNSSREISNPAVGAAGTYKYDVTLKQEDGTLLFKLDPQIIVGSIRGGTTTDREAAKTASPSPSPSPKASPSPSPRKP